MRHTNNYAENFTYWLSKDRIPVTKSLIIASVLSFVMAVLFKSKWLVLLGFSSTWFTKMPWTAITYPLITPLSQGPINLLLAGYWMWVVGGSLERAWSTRVFSLFFFGMSAITALGLFCGALVTKNDVALWGLWLPLAGVTIAFAMLNPEQEILFFFVIPLKLKYLALLDVALVFLNYAKDNLMMGLFALIGCAFSYWYVTRGRNSDYSSYRQTDREKVIRLYARKNPSERLNPLKWYSSYKDKKKFKDFLNKSGFKD